MKISANLTDNLESISGLNDIYMTAISVIANNTIHADMQDAENVIGGLTALENVLATTTTRNSLDQFMTIEVLLDIETANSLVARLTDVVYAISPETIAWSIERTKYDLDQYSDKSIVERLEKLTTPFTRIYKLDGQEVSDVIAIYSLIHTMITYASPMTYELLATTKNTISNKVKS